jgi:hypothetical protein
MSARTPLAVIAVALALAALAVPADGSLPRAEPLVYGGRVLCPFPRHPERCRGPHYNGALGMQLSTIAALESPPRLLREGLEEVVV